MAAAFWTDSYSCREITVSRLVRAGEAGATVEAGECEYLLAEGAGGVQAHFSTAAAR